MMSQDTPQLPRRRLGRTELEIPVIPFGTLGFSNNFGFVTDEDAIALIKHAVSLGANHFDCARCYGDSMRKLGLALREIPRHDVIITGRLCCHSDAPWGGYRGAGEADYSAERAIRDVEDQLELLGTDYFDGMLIHDPNRIEPHAGQRRYSCRSAAIEGTRPGAKCRFWDGTARLPLAGNRNGRR